MFFVLFFNSYTFPVYVQGDQLNMAVILWYLVKKSALSSVRYCLLFTLQFTSSMSITYSKVPEKNTAINNWSPCILIFNFSPGEQDHDQPKRG